VRARAPGEEAEPVAHPVQLGPERIRHGRLEPAQHPRAPAREHDPSVPRVAQDLVEAVRTPDRERVRSVAARDVDDVVLERELPQVGRRPREEGQVRDLGAIADLREEL
jgi:hypothetical protein